mgnify:CR=1 FL=1
MGYIGREPQVGNFQVCDAISVVNGQAAYTMQVGSVNVSPETANHMIVSLNGVLQKPGSSFTVSGSTITFASNLVTGDVIDFIHILGSVLDLGVPSDDTVTAAKASNNFISGQTELATAPADTDEFLISDAGTLKRIDYSLIKGGGITVADQFRVTANITSNQDPVSSNIERIDTAGQGTITDLQMSESSGIFTFPTTGIYLVMANSGNINISGNDSVSLTLNVTTDNSSFTGIASANDGSSNVSASCSIQSLVDVTDVSNVKCSFTVGSISSGTKYECNTSSNTLTFTFIRLADT